MKLDILQKSMVEAMKAHDKVRKDAISSLIGAIKKVAIDKKCKDNIPESLVDEVILKEKKSVQEMIDTCPTDRTTLLQEYKERMAVIDEFAPKMMSEDEVCREVYRILATVDIFLDEKGAIMKTVMPRMKGKADMKMVKRIVEDILGKTK